MPWNPSREEDEDAYNIECFRLPSQEQNTRASDPLSRVLTCNTKDEGLRQIWDDLARLGPPLTDELGFFPIDESEVLVNRGCSNVYKEQMEGWRRNNYKCFPAERVYPPDWNRVQERYNEYPQIMDKEKINEMRKFIDHIFLVQWHPDLGRHSDGIPEYDPENPEFPWSQKITDDDRLFSWEREIVELRIASKSYTIGTEVPVLTEAGDTNFQPEHIGPWDSGWWGYAPYPKGAEPPKWYKPNATISLDKTAEQIGKIPGHIGLFWALGGKKHIRRETARACSRDGVLTLAYGQNQSFKTLGLSCYGPVAYDGTLVGCTGTFTLPDYVQIWERDGHAQITSENTIAVDDAYPSYTTSYEVKFYIIQQHPRRELSHLFYKWVHDDVIYMPGVKNWFDYFPEFAEERWPYKPTE